MVFINSFWIRKEAKILVKRFDGEKPVRYLKEVLDYIGLNEKNFYGICDKFRSPHLWAYKNKKAAT